MDNKRPYKYIGDRINTLLARDGVTQKELAELLGLEQSPNTVSYYVGGQRKPKLEELLKMAEHFDTSVDYLLGRTEVPTTDANIKAVCEFLGLSENAVIGLHNWGRRHSVIFDKDGKLLPQRDEHLTTADDLLELNVFQFLCHHLCELRSESAKIFEDNRTAAEILRHDELADIRTLKLNKLLLNIMRIYDERELDKNRYEDIMDKANAEMRADVEREVDEYVSVVWTDGED